MNNFEKIKAMSIDEMARWMFVLHSACGFCPVNKAKTCEAGNCQYSWKQWLEQESEEE